VRARRELGEKCSERREGKKNLSARPLRRIEKEVISSSAYSVFIVGVGQIFFFPSFSARYELRYNARRNATDAR